MNKKKVSNLTPFLFDIIQPLFEKQQHFLN